MRLKQSARLLRAPDADAFASNCLATVACVSSYFSRARGVAVAKQEITQCLVYVTQFTKDSRVRPKRPGDVLPDRPRPFVRCQSIGPSSGPLMD